MLIGLLFLWWQRSKKQKNLEAKQTEDILNTPLEKYGSTEAEVMKYNDYAKKALTARNEDDARIFLKKKQELENVGTGLAQSYAAAHENAENA